MENIMLFVSDSLMAILTSKKNLQIIYINMIMYINS